MPPHTNKIARVKLVVMTINVFAAMTKGLVTKIRL